MARKKSPGLTEAELKIMHVLWDCEKATVNDILVVLAEDPDALSLAYNTILTTVRIMERKGYVRHKKHGRSHLFIPRITRAQARQKALHHMVSSLFDDSPEQLLNCLLKSEDLSPSDIDRLKEMIEESEKIEE
ncbi:MAG: BlaI/MecI/CopY family transcriptional regulator [Planctomycetota bacterium]